MDQEPPKTGDRDSPEAKTQKLEPTSPTAENQPHQQRDDLPTTLVVDVDDPVATVDQLSASPAEHLEQNCNDLSDSQLDGQVDEDEDKLEGETTHHQQHQESTIVPTSEDKVLSPVKSQPSSPVKAESSMEIEKSKTPTPPDTSAVDSSERNSIYHVKWISWGPSSTDRNRSGNEGSRRVGIMTQNENGPCPLLSIVNVLLLRGKLTLPEGCEVISAEQLLEFLGEVISESVPGNLADDTRLNYEQNLADAMCIMPKLQTGLDVNVHFTGVSKFEYTPECIIFDLLDIPLYHGWLIDPQQEEVCTAVNSASYNQLVEMIIANKTSKDSELVSQSLVAQQFLEESASQLTYHGLCELNGTMKDDELAVFFRNNHFSTIYKRKKELFLLVTDQGFLKEPRVVWETLNSIDGDNQFVNDNFMTVTPTSEESGEDNLQEQAALTASCAGQTATKQIDRDLQLAMTLAREEESEAGCDWEEYQHMHLGDTTGLTDEQIALRLQAAEENQAAREQQQQERAQQRQQQQQQLEQQRDGTRERSRGQSSHQPQQHPRDSRSRNCAIL